MIKRIRYNSPVILTFAFLSILSLIVDRLTAGLTNRLLFSVYRSSLTDPLTYVRLFTHVLGHANLEHWAGNMTLFLLLGPILEEKYGSRKLLGLFAIVAFVTGLVNMIFFPNTALLGASGIVYMMIVLASIAGSAKGDIPLTLIIAAVVYIGQECYAGLFTADNISHISHVIGGVCGCFFGLARSGENKPKKN